MDKIEKIYDYIREKGSKQLFILISIQMSFLIISCVTFIILENNQTDAEYRRENLYKWLILLLFSLSQYYYAWHSIIKKNMLELLAYLIISICTTTASTLRYFYISMNEELDHKILVQSVCYIYIVFSIFVQIVGLISYKYFLEAFRDEIFKKIGASVNEQNKFKWFTSFECLLEVYAQLTLLIFVTFFFFFDTSIDDQKQVHLIADICAIVIIIIGFAIGYIGVKKRQLKLVYLYFGVAFLICIAENVKLFLFLQYYDYQFEKIHLDWATFSIITIVFSSSIIVLGYNFYYGYKCVQLKLMDIKTFDADKNSNDHFLSQYDY
ncbi:unnamed protein product (macronuclear) [Paramecium tetraurelia]|uniref:Transmembrane protein n=1 Tax=Paramecium tetraurelia TaxID=5888 RepID=A0CNP9_PARTE|nr:uncharacterized protein GSPATT00008858001 [Paramecium tetraurelia]CAK72416.1 unnamed protein product [Paramecium tetraurelia]|eukprot:XP_001439813.1 hypothetical protein (macronuclear) [Paramecium tetraurelia strain d4-2]